jgi:hypothetical protein
MPILKECEIPCRGVRNKTIGYMIVPIIILALLFPILIFAGVLTPLSLFGDGGSGSTCCKTGINLSVNSSFYITVYDGSSIVEDQNESYCVNGIELYLLSLDPVLAKFIMDNPTNYSQIIDAQNFLTYMDIDIIPLFNASHFNITNLSNIYNDADRFDGTSVKICKEPAFLMAMIGVYVYRNDSHALDDFAFSPMAPNSLGDLPGLLGNNSLAIWNCSEGFINFDIAGASYNQTSGDFIEMYAHINGRATTIREEAFLFI